MMTIARSGPRPQFIPTTSAPAARRLRATSAGLSPHIVRSRSCSSSNWKNIVAITGRAVALLQARVAAGVEVALVDRADDVGVRVVPQLRAGAIQEPGGEEHRAVAAVEDQRLAAADALEDFPPARAHDGTASATPRRAFALTTARVESLAYPSAPISSANAWLTGAPPIITFTRWRSPALTSASIVRFIAGMVVVIRAEIPTMFAPCSVTAFTKASGAT